MDSYNDGIASSALLLTNVKDVNIYKAHNDCFSISVDGLFIMASQILKI